MPAKSTKPSSPSLERYRVPILDRTLDLLELLKHQPQGLTLAGMTGVLKIPKNTVFRIATTLTLRGYVERDADSKIYRLSTKLVSLAQGSAGGVSMIQKAAPVLESLRVLTQETAILGTIAGRSAVVLDQNISAQSVRVVMDVGQVVGLHTSAIAKAILSKMEPTAQKELLRSYKFQRKTKTSITSARAFKAALAQVAKQGFAIEAGEDDAARVAVAASVTDVFGKVVAAVAVTAPSYCFTKAQLTKLGQQVKRHAHLLTMAMEGRG